MSKNFLSCNFRYVLQRNGVNPRGYHNGSANLRLHSGMKVTELPPNNGSLFMNLLGYRRTAGLGFFTTVFFSLCIIISLLLTFLLCNCINNNFSFFYSNGEGRGRSLVNANSWDKRMKHTSSIEAEEILGSDTNEGLSNIKSNPSSLGDISNGKTGDHEWTFSNHIRNVAVIAHVDHGKTTLVEKLLKESGADKGTGRLDAGALESERGITIVAKCTGLVHNGVNLNIVDTPGHADFGGEVERVLGMVDSVILLVDSVEGPMTQTKFVLTKALQRGLKPLVVLTKVDREGARVDQVESDIFDLFANLNATEEQLDFPTIYASAKDGWAVRDLKKEKRENMKPLLDFLLNYVPPPAVLSSAPFSMLVTMLSYDKFLGRLLTGRVRSGSVKVGDPVHALSYNGQSIEVGKITKILKRKGLADIELKEAGAGDIVTIAGLSKATVTDTVSHPSHNDPISTHPIDPPTISMSFTINDSPLCGRSGSKMSSQQLKERLYQELENNVSIKVLRSKERADEYEVQGRGEMQLGVLIENMRREGFELSISPPKVVCKEEDGKTFEPLEEVFVEVDQAHVGSVIEKLSIRKGEMIEMKPVEGNKVKLQFLVPSRGLIGYRAEFQIDTHGSGVLNRIFHSYIPFKGQLDKIKKGAIISSEKGKASAYALEMLEPRGQLFIKPGTDVYPGMIIGEHNRDNDLDVNPTKERKVSNVRTLERDDTTHLTPPKTFSLEEALCYIGADEIVEVTPASIILRKRVLDPDARKRMLRNLRNS